MLFRRSRILQAIRRSHTTRVMGAACADGCVSCPTGLIRNRDLLFLGRKASLSAPPAGSFFGAHHHCKIGRTICLYMRCVQMSDEIIAP